MEEWHLPKFNWVLITLLKLLILHLLNVFFKCYFLLLFLLCNFTIQEIFKFPSERTDLGFDTAVEQEMHSSFVD